MNELNPLTVRATLYSAAAEHNRKEERVDYLLKAEHIEEYAGEVENQEGEGVWGRPPYTTFKEVVDDFFLYMWESWEG